MEIVMMTAKQAIAQAKPRFMKAAELNGLDWPSESVFALQAVEKSDYLERVARNNPWSLMMAMINVAAIGITLNPARKLAFLVPRDGEVILDISYRGLIHLAVSAGSIRWAKAEIVREHDQFQYLGPAEKPEHRFNPFAEDRGEIVGVYAMAEIPGGAILTETLTAKEIWQIRDMSDLYARKKTGPWVWFEGEMVKKVAIKRAAKTWPSCSKLDEAIDYLNRDAGEGLIMAVETDRSSTKGPPDIEGKIIPDIPEDSEIPEQIREYVDRVVIRCEKTQLWKNGRDLVTERYSGRFRDWALAKLDQAESQLKEAAS